MNQTHLHLIITHLPVFGSLLGGLVLAFGLWRRSAQTNVAAYLLFILSALGAGIAYLTGEAAEETVEHLPGVTENLIGQHEDFAVYALVSLVVLGVASVAGIVVTARQPSFSKKVAFPLLLLSLVSFGLAARTGFLGGQIRHTELSTNAATQTQNSERSDHD